MEKVTITTFRQNLFQIADRVLQTGTPVTITRKGKKLLLKAEAPILSKLIRLKRRKLIKGNPECLVEVKAGKWREPSYLK